MYQEHFESLPEARKRERQLKSWKSHRSVQELIDASKKSSWAHPGIAGELVGLNPTSSTYPLPTIEAGRTFANWAFVSRFVS